MYIWWKLINFMDDQWTHWVLVVIVIHGAKYEELEVKASN